MSAPAVSGGLGEFRCVPWWTGEEWWCPHAAVVALDTDLAAQHHYMTGSERMLDYIGAED